MRYSFGLGESSLNHRRREEFPAIFTIKVSFGGAMKERAFVLNEDPQGNYEKVIWNKELSRGEYMVCHTLATSSQVYGKGIGKQMVEYCIQYAKSRGYRAVRLDVVPDNIPARKLYEKCGFVYVGDVDLERGIEAIPEFSMYEYWVKD